MGWFDEQIKTRKINDDESLDNAFAELVYSLLGDRSGLAELDKRFVIKNAMDEILLYYHLKSGEIPEEITDVEQQIDYLLRPHGIMQRSVKLSAGWYKDCVGPLLGIMKDGGAVVALIPDKFGGYSFRDAATGKRVSVNKKTETLLESEALCFYKPLPMRSLSLGDMLRYIVDCLNIENLIQVMLLSAFIMLIGMIGPKINYLVFSRVLPSGNARLLLSIAVFSVCFSVSTVLFRAIESMLNSNISTQLDMKVEAATMARMLSLPPSFFKDYSSGELSYKMSYMNSLCSMLFQSVFSTSFTSLLSLIYVFQIFKYAPILVVPSLLITLATLIVTIITTVLQMKITKKTMELSEKESGMTYSMISGVQKIKLAGAEKRMFARWLKLYSKSTKLQYNPPVFIKLSGVLTAAITLIGNVVIYFFAVKGGVTVAEFNAFNASYAMISAAFMSFAGVATTIAQIKPILDEVKPIMDAQPEMDENRRVVTKLNGNIELSNVTFRYDENMPNVIDGLSLNIKAGQYVAIVGKTGCGKSTLVRLILGFEKPQKGTVYFDRYDINSLDLKSLRSKIGVVMQNGKLFYGDLFSNITISAPTMTLKEAWEAAEIAGIADDIRAMPMGMNTMVSEGQGGFSGGQKQRLMIARAIAPKPKILIFDEATSALDNITQRKVSDALDKLKCTRIVIAHRLSTIRQCDRIIVLDGGRIIEDGTYDELIAQNGFFAELVERQRIDT